MGKKQREYLYLQLLLELREGLHLKCFLSGNGLASLHGAVLGCVRGVWDPVWDHVAESMGN